MIMPFSKNFALFFRNEKRAKPHAWLKKYTAHIFPQRNRVQSKRKAIINSPHENMNPGSDGRGSGLANGGHGSWKAGSVEGLVLRLHHDGCTRDLVLMILSLMAVCEGRSPGVSVVIRGF